jgi:hypothetical protein
VVAQATTAANAQGYACTLRLAERHAPGARVWAIEGSGATSPATSIASCRTRVPR